ncbi:MAG: formyl transferase [Hyphomicrobiaceae bacterium]|nr:formyl transferase [Hyphomicrobiaceae bacterium]
MRIGLIVSSAELPSWTGVLFAHIAASGQHEVGLVAAPSRTTPKRGAASASLDRLQALERLGAGRHRGWLIDAMATPSAAASLPHLLHGAPMDLALDLLGDGSGQSTPHSARTLTPLLDGAPVAAGLWPALLSRRAPVIAVHDSASGAVSTLALPALHAPHRLLESADAVLSHLVRCLADAALSVASTGALPHFASTPLPRYAAAPGTVSLAAMASFLAARMTAAIAVRGQRLLKQEPVWQVAWRRAETRLHVPQTLDAVAYRRVPDDSRRYYADPFLFEHQGTLHLFVEELPSSSGRGVISHVAFGNDGPIGSPTPVLTEPHHLSYPQVFARDGEVWMLPEAAQSGRLTLYRAAPFPSRWVPHATLIAEPLHDATLFEHGGRLWITAATVVGAASSWDTLSIWSAERLAGPWSPHPKNPVLVDARAARPAGVPYVSEGVLWRPAQDCRHGYGAGLSLCRVTELSPTGFAQEIAATYRFDSAAGFGGFHTINHTRELEVIDLIAPRLPRAHTET